MAYNVANWYWIVAGSTTQVWASARWSYVPVTDSTYVAWKALNQPTIIDTAANLHAVLLNQLVPQVLSAGVIVTSTGTPALNGTYAIDPVSTANISAIAAGIAAGKPLPGGGGTFNYPDTSNAMHAFSAANFLNFGSAVETFFYNFTQGLYGLLTGVGGASLPSNALTIA
jgi:hypothetical protein